MSSGLRGTSRAIDRAREASNGRPEKSIDLGVSPRRLHHRPRAAERGHRRGVRRGASRLAAARRAIKVIHPTHAAMRSLSVQLLRRGIASWKSALAPELHTSRATNAACSPIKRPWVAMRVSDRRQVDRRAFVRRTPRSRSSDLVVDAADGGRRARARPHARCRASSADGVIGGPHTDSSIAVLGARMGRRRRARLDPRRRAVQRHPRRSASSRISRADRVARSRSRSLHGRCAHRRLRTSPRLITDEMVAREPIPRSGSTAVDVRDRATWLAETIDAARPPSAPPASSISPRRPSRTRPACSTSAFRSPVERLRSHRAPYWGRRLLRSVGPEVKPCRNARSIRGSARGMAAATVRLHGAR